MNFEKERFAVRFDALYNGQRLGINREAASQNAPWFTLRRLLVALVILYIRYDQMYLQAILLIHLALADACIKFHVVNYEAELTTLLERLNDCFVILGSYYLLMLTDFP